MKILSDTGCFDRGRRLRPQFSGQSAHCHIHRRSFFRALPFLVDDAEQQMFYCEGSYEVKLLAGAHYRRWRVPTLSVEYVREGVLLVRQRGVGRIMEPGEIFLMQPEIDGEFMVAPQQSCHKLSITLKGRLLKNFLQESGLDAVDVLTEVNRHRFERLFHRFEEIAAGTGRENTLQNTLACVELLEFLRRPGPVQEIPPRLLELRDYLADHLESPLSLEQLARRQGCSRTHLHRLCQTYFGMPPYQMLIRMRMHRAAGLLLKHPELSIKEITAQVGYANALNFSTEFRRHFHLSPRDYRRCNGLRS